jgi:hypothetical protein
MGHSAGMARKLRLQYPGAIYHLRSRGDHLVEMDCGWPRENRVNREIPEPREKTRPFAYFACFAVQ